jgi:hypothetical protein
VWPGAGGGQPGLTARISAVDEPDSIAGLVRQHLAARIRDHAAMGEILREIRAADSLDRAAHRFAGRFDQTDTDEGLEQLQTEVTMAITDALVRVANAHGWSV